MVVYTGWSKPKEQIIRMQELIKLLDLASARFVYVRDNVYAHDNDSVVDFKLEIEANELKRLNSYMVDTFHIKKDTDSQWSRFKKYLRKIRRK